MNTPSLVVPSLQGPELFIGLIGPIGTDLSSLLELLQTELHSVAYSFKEIRMSQLFAGIPKFEQRVSQLSAGREDARIDGLMDIGDELRTTTGSGAVVVHLAMVKMRSVRQRPQPRTAFIFNSLKRPEEVTALRKIYGEAFVAISLYGPKEQRVQNLARRIEKSLPSGVRAEDRARELVEKDAAAKGRELGQSVAATFPMADAFIRDGTREEVHPQVTRLIEILFGQPFKTPTREELCMFQAKAVALRSADLSRQVGAVIADDDGAIVAAGCNEVPKATGGTYWTGDKPDYRDFQMGSDANARTKVEILHEFLDAMKPWLSDEYRGKPRDELAREAAAGPMRDTRISSLLEFGRMVHAEMNALMDAARRGHAVKDMTMYCTTFPCHVCTRHILAAGVRRVIFIEPYPKSLASKMYRPAICVDEEAADADALRFESFVGIAPRRYLDCFEMVPRKDKDGFVVAWPRERAEPRFRPVIEQHLDRETALAAELQKVADLIGLT